MYMCIFEYMYDIRYVDIRYVDLYVLFSHIFTYHSFQYQYYLLRNAERTLYYMIKIWKFFLNINDHHISIIKFFYF